MRIGLILPTIFAAKQLFPERIFAPADLLRTHADELARKGHEVYVFSSPDFATNAKLIPTSLEYALNNTQYAKFRNLNKERREVLNSEVVKRNFELATITNAFAFAVDKKIDILHCYHDSIFFTAHYINSLISFPVVYSLHDPLPPRGSFEYSELYKFKEHPFIALSEQMKKSFLKLNFVATIHHGVDLADPVYSFTATGYLDYLAFIGRIVPEKGTYEAIKMANKLNLKLRLASSIEDSANSKYYNEKVKPFLGKKNYEFTGFISGSEKNKFYAQARCLLFPIQWEEPFGLVMVEAMACGTPVVAYARGSVPEVVKDGQTGFVVNQSEKYIRGDWLVKKTGMAGLIEAIERIYSMQDKEYQQMRRACRAHVEENFTVSRMAEQYIDVYQRLIR